jgi:hypothetical protein
MVAGEERFLSEFGTSTSRPIAAYDDLTTPLRDEVPFGSQSGVVTSRHPIPTCVTENNYTHLIQRSSSKSKPPRVLFTMFDWVKQRLEIAVLLRQPWRSNQSLRASATIACWLLGFFR